MKRRRTSDALYRNVFVGLVVVLVILYGINIFVTGQIVKPLGASKKERPANLHLTLITNDCDNCYSMDNMISFVKSQNVKIIQEKTLPYTEKEAQDIVAENNIKSLPALVITGETLQDNIFSLWDSIGADFVGNVVVVSNIPPYYSLDSQKVVGLVQVTMLTDNSCAECYDVENHIQILTSPRFGVYVDKSLTYDISSANGKEFLEKYNITKVPTMVISPDVSVYSSLVQIWNQVGTVEKDGWLVFRTTEQMGTYKDISQNKVINATR